VVAREAARCPSGRLVIAVTSADGRDYEVRNRVTLCRCGSSRNKPFCDGSHVTIRFTGT
jgi:CDGSH-type Zn-finger protein